MMTIKLMARLSPMTIHKQQRLLSSLFVGRAARLPAVASNERAGPIWAGSRAESRRLALLIGNGGAI